MVSPKYLNCMYKKVKMLRNYTPLEKAKWVFSEVNLSCMKLTSKKRLLYEVFILFIYFLKGSIGCWYFEIIWK